MFRHPLEANHQSVQESNTGTVQLLQGVRPKCYIHTLLIVFHEVAEEGPLFHAITTQTVYFLHLPLISQCQAHTICEDLECWTIGEICT